MTGTDASILVVTAPVGGPLFAAFGALVLTGIGMVPAASMLRWLGLQQIVRRQGPAAHLRKEGTPMAAGMVFVPAAALAAWAMFPRSGLLLVSLVVMLGHGVLGFADDYLKVVGRRTEGLKARYKLVGQLGLAGLLAWVALHAGLGRALLVPFSRSRISLSPPMFVVLVMVAVLGTTNGANFTDGADGLLASTGGVALLAFGVLAWSGGQGAIAAAALGLVGALLAFLRWNWHPAQVFMGDTGSMAIGACLAAVAVCTGTLLYLPIIGLLFLLEVLSVIAQVFWFRRTGKRLLRMAPLHHHLELGGWREGRLVLRLLAFSGACAVVGMAAFWVR